MRSYDTLILNAVKEQRAGSPGAATARLAAAQTAFTSDIDVLNYALTLEHLEAAFYALGPNYQFGQDPFGNDIDAWLTAVGEHENAHVTTLTDVITPVSYTHLRAHETVLDLVC